MITIVSTGFWLLNQPSDMCLGISTSAKYDGRGEFTSIIYVGAGFGLIVTVLCLFVMPMRHNWKNGESSNKRVIIAVTCFGLQLVFLILFASLYALTQSTVGFASLPRWISSPERWMSINHCLDSNVCVHFRHKYADDTQDQFFARHLTPIESGCCKPPLDCNFSFSSPTIWIKPSNGTYSNPDCYEWENDPKKLCYNCQVCKLGYVQELKKAWTISGIFVVTALLFFVSGFMLPRKLVKEHEELS
ncbi:tetraspanin-8-like [Chenopodium quinoa]|uniref:tetraspanin-8-like n=1 Tax=Chenopodium quinoa TaxID=63459 RepID=UPI000B77965F|nr:tetraspanin-8-like [Chenopodium quinoa]